MFGVVALALAGCRAPSRSADDAMVAMRVAEHEERVLEQRDRIASRFLRRLELLQARATERGETGPVEVNVLLLSSGGQYGAFGVGVLNGWSDNGQGEFDFPTFDIVTGVSTGAMIAPFVLSEEDYSIQRIADLFKQADDSFAILRGVFFFMPWRSSIFDTRVLRERIASEVDEAAVLEVAVAHEEHRILLVGAVDLDLGRFHIWDMGPIAEQAIHDGNLSRFHDAMISSASIPAAFPPIEIDGVLYTDGAVALATFLGLDRDVVRQSVAEYKRRHPEAQPPRLRMWMIVNGHIDTQAELARQGWTSVALRSASVIARYSLRTTLRQMQLGAELMGRDIEMPVEFRYIAVPDDVDLLEPTNRLFDQAFMAQLHALGYRMGSEASSWRTDAISPDIPGGSIQLRDVRFDATDPTP
jgi:predicted patatin/cPLA2 family phospholipase